MTSVNLLEETLDIMKHNNKTPKDVDWIGSYLTNHRITWDEFKQLADKKYDNSTSKFQIAYDLMIVFKDGNSWMERVHDGKWEHWIYHSVPIKKNRDKKIKNIFGKDQTLEQINNV